MDTSTPEEGKLSTKLSSWVNNSLRRHSTIDRTLHYLLDSGGSGYQGTSAEDVSWVLGEVYETEESFLSDFQSRIWCTYRSNFTQINQNDPMMRDLGLDGLSTHSYGHTPNHAPTPTPTPKSSHWLLRERTYNSDQGWGCMLRTSQSLLANTLQILSLGRHWRRSKYLNLSDYSQRKEYVRLVRLLILFMDSPSPLSPFSVHRMAVVGKSLGKEIGEWFGPSTAALTIRHLVNNQHDVDLSVSVASDSVIYKSDVYQASGASTEWGHKPVLILVGIRLGLDGVHPRYYETLKAFLRIKSCVGIAGGRPSSSYYFFGYQSDSLFYVDPHMIKPAMTTRVPPSEAELKTEIESLLRCNSASSGSTSGSTSTSDKQPGTKSTPSTPNTTPTKHLSKNGHRRRKTSMMLGGVTNKNRRRSSSSATLGEEGEIEDCLPSSSSQSSQDDSVGWKKLSHFPSTSSHSVPQTIPESSSSSFIKDIPNLDELSDKWYIDTYSGSTISSYFCDKPRKMNMNQMDPSMLLGFVVRDGEEFDRFVREVRELPQQIFSVADAPRSFGDDEDVQSISSSSSSSNVGASVAQAQDEEWSNIRKESMEEEGAELVDRMKLSDRGSMSSLEDCLISR